MSVLAEKGVLIPPRLISRFIGDIMFLSKSLGNRSVHVQAQVRFAMFTRMAIGLLIGALAAAMVEFINGCFTFMLPPLIILTPLCLTISLVVAGVTGFRQRLSP